MAGKVGMTKKPKHQRKAWILRWLKRVRSLAERQGCEFCDQRDCAIVFKNTTGTGSLTWRGRTLAISEGWRVKGVTTAILKEEVRKCRILCRSCFRGSLYFGLQTPDEWWREGEGQRWG